MKILLIIVSSKWVHAYNKPQLSLNAMHMRTHTSHNQIAYIQCIEKMY